MFFRRSEPFESNGYDYFYNNSDGTLVRRVKVGATAEDVIYVGDLYERKLSGTTTTVTKYYYAEGRRIAMRTGGTLYFLATDHLGGTSVVMNSTGSLVNRVRYYPFGNVRTQEGGTPITDRLFTGQRRLSENGIYNYGARTYNATIGRFLQADAVVPGAGNPQALNRYSYVLNNPMRYTDPSGNCPVDLPGCGPGRVGRSQSMDWFAEQYDYWMTFLEDFERGPLDPVEPYVGLAASFVPGIGEANDIIGLVSGCDMLGGRECGINDWRRALFGLGLGPFSGHAALKGTKLLKFSDEAADVAKTASRAEGHHLLPKEALLRAQFERAGLDIDEFVVELPAGRHRLKDFGGLHTGSNNWNKQWREFFATNHDAKAPAIMDQLRLMTNEAGIPWNPAWNKYTK